MSLLNFPTNPTLNQTYSIGNSTWVWNGAAWIKLTSSPLTSITVNVITASTSTQTGSLVVQGGLGVGGSINAGSTSTINGAEILTTATLDNYVKQTVITAGTDTVVTEYADNGQSYFTIWNTSTLQTVTDRGNTTNNQIKITNSTGATSVGTGALIVDGGISATGDLWLGGTIYSAGVPVITTSTLIDHFYAGTDIYIEAIPELTTSAYTIIISNTSTLQTVTSRGSSTDHIVYFTNTTNSTSSSTGAVVISGGLGVGGRINSESLQIADTIMDSGLISINTTATTIIDEYSLDEYRSAKYLIQIEAGSGETAEFETIEILLLVDNRQTVYATEYAVLSSNGELGDFASDIENDNFVRLYFTPYYTIPMTLQIFRSAMRS
jgi:hypothetical protein